MEGVQLLCGADGETSRTATACGGAAVTTTSAFSLTTWYFDASGKLVGLFSQGDVPSECLEGTTSAASTYGDACATVGEPTDECAAVCGGPPIECGDDASCPETYDDLSLEPCEQSGRVLTNVTTCGGTSATVTTPQGSTFYCFDPWGRLIGAGTQAEDGSRTLTRGVACRLEGTARDWCRKQG